MCAMTRHVRELDVFVLKPVIACGSQPSAIFIDMNNSSTSCYGGKARKIHQFHTHILFTSHDFTDNAVSGTQGTKGISKMIKQTYISTKSRLGGDP